MKICSEGHPEIVYGDRYCTYCPACDYKDEAWKYQRDLEELRKIIVKLEFALAESEIKS